MGYEVYCDYRRAESDGIARMNTRQYLESLMQRYTVDHLVNVSPDEFEQYIKSLIGVRNNSLPDLEHRRDASVTFQWGHNHDFGTFQMEGKMGDRHIDLLTKCIDQLGLPRDLTDKSVLDVGCWTGGVSLLLNAMGAEVFAIDEVYHYTRVLRGLAQWFGLFLTVDGCSLYGLLRTPYHLSAHARSDYVCFFGVFYHITDPVLALRIMFNELKDGGILFLETAISQKRGSVCEYHGPSHNTKWNWFVPSVKALLRMIQDVGFEIENMVITDKRALVSCKRVEYRGMLRAGLSRANV